MKCKALFRNEFNTFNNTRARMLYSIYHMTLKFLKISGKSDPSEIGRTNNIRKQQAWFY